MTDDKITIKKLEAEILKLQIQNKNLNKFITSRNEERTALLKQITKLKNYIKELY